MIPTKIKGVNNLKVYDTDLELVHTIIKPWSYFDQKQPFKSPGTLVNLSP